MWVSGYRIRGTLIPQKQDVRGSTLVKNAAVAKNRSARSRAGASFFAEEPEPGLRPRA